MMLRDRNLIFGSHGPERSHDLIERMYLAENKSAGAYWLQKTRLIIRADGHTCGEGSDPEVQPQGRDIIARALASPFGPR